MMAKESNNPNNGQTNTIIGPNTEMHGNLNVKGAAIIYGTVVGDVKAAGLVRTAPESLIKGSVTAKEAIIDGELDGSLTVSGRATLGASARVLGEVRVELLVIEEGAQFTGKCKMKGAKITRDTDNHSAAQQGQESKANEDAAKDAT